MSLATEDLPYLLMDLAEIKYRGKYANASLISPSYIPGKRRTSRDGIPYESLKSGD